MNMSQRCAAVVTGGVLAGAMLAAAQPAGPAVQQDVRAREEAFAKSMADRNHPAFVSFLSAEAVFAGGAQTFRGPQQIGDAWKRFFDGAQAPFSWRPETVEVLDSGTLAMTSGPVFDPQGMRIGTFNSIWRREPDGIWRVVFDNGCP